MDDVLFKKIVDNREEDSYATAMRRKRFQFFLELLARIPPPFSILDVGGTANFWQRMGVVEQDNIRITLLNLDPTPLPSRQFRAVVGDATNMREFKDGAFDVVFSNSVIEHVGDFDQQRRMADEVRRVGRRYFLQTPNYFFPLEPHFLFPGFQWLPRDARVGLIRRFNLGWVKRITDRVEAEARIDHTRLLRRSELQALFPDANWYEEKIMGLTKSFVVYEGW